MKDLLQIHAESKADYGRLEEELRQLLCLNVEGMNERETIGEAEDESNRRRQQTGGSNNQSDEEDIL